jgi:hypothetical protein
VTKPDSSGCPTVFMDSTGALVLLYQSKTRAPAQTPAPSGIQPRFICTPAKTWRSWRLSESLR